MKSHFYFYGDDAKAKAERFIQGHKRVEKYVQPGRVCVVLG